MCENQRKYMNFFVLVDIYVDDENTTINYYLQPSCPYRTKTQIYK